MSEAIRTEQGVTISEVFIDCPKCGGKKTVKCTYIENGGPNQFIDNFYHECSVCDYKEKEENSYAGSIGYEEPWPRCPFCGRDCDPKAYSPKIPERLERISERVLDLEKKVENLNEFLTRLARWQDQHLYDHQVLQTQYQAQRIRKTFFKRVNELAISIAAKIWKAADQLREKF